MARAPGESREPWVKIKVGLRTNDKVAELPNSAARWGWVCALLLAKTARRMGVFANRRHLRDLLGADGRYVPTFIAAGLVHEVPADGLLGCTRCAHLYRDARPGELVIHDYRLDQRDPTNAERAQGLTERDGPTPSAQRTRAWRLRSAVFERDRYTCRYCGIADYPREWLVAEHVVADGPDTMDNLVTACRPCNARKGPHSLEQVGMTLLPVPIGDATPVDGDASQDTDETHHGDESQASRDASPGRVSSRARGTTVTVTETVTVDRAPTPGVGGAGTRAGRGPSSNGSSGTRLTADQLAQWADFGPEWDAFRVAWLERGFRLPPFGGPGDGDDSQRGLLWQVVDAWPTAIAGWVREVPKGATTRQVIDHVIERFHERRAEAGVDDPEWARAKEDERARAGRAMAGIGAVLSGLSGDGGDLDFGDGA